MSVFRVTQGQQLARISARHDGQIVKLDPQRFRYDQSAYDAFIKEAKLRIKETIREYGIEHAKKIKEWDALLPIAADKLAEQQLFVAWWKATVREAGQPQKELAGTAANTLSRAEAERLTGMKHQRVSDLSIRLADEDGYLRHLIGAEYFAAYLEMPLPRGATGTGENEWFTPEPFIALARNVLGKIDLDPATSAQAQKIVRASRFYTMENDGLTKNWRGRVWLNPPFAQPTIDHFVTKMVSEYKSKRVAAAIMLTHNYTDTSWFHLAVSAASAICFTRGRVKFYKPNGKIAAATQGQAFFYFGRAVARFRKVFSEVGFTVTP